MARRRLLSDELWARHLEPPADEREIARHYTLGAEDLAQVAARRGDANRLGYALVILYLRFPGRVLEVGEAPPDGRSMRAEAGSISHRTLRFATVDLWASTGHKEEVGMIGRLIAALIGLLVVSVAVLLIFFRSTAPNTLAFEGAKALIQLGIISAIGAFISIATFEYQRVRQKQDRARELCRQRLESREQLRRSILANSRAAYSATKRARRLLRARAIVELEGSEMVALQEYDRWLETLNDAQLNLENVVLDIDTSGKTFSDPASLTNSLMSMESYLGDLVDEYETHRRKFQGEQSSFLLISLPKLADFIAPRAGSKFDKAVKKPYHDLRRRIRADLLDPAVNSNKGDADRCGAAVRE